MNIKNSKGITLVALVVTIVVLLILAGVSINLVLGENGLITQAQEAKRKTLLAEEKDNKDFYNIDEFVYDNTSNINVEKVTDTNPGVLEKENDNIYVINSIEDLVAFAYDVRNGNSYAGKTVKLGLDLDFKSTNSYVDANRSDYKEYGYDGNLKKLLTSGEGFLPIGTFNEDEAETKSFAGIFDGNNHTISNCYMYKNTEERHRISFFGQKLYGEVKNLGLVNINFELINKDVSCSVSGISTKPVNGAKISNCYVSGNIKEISNGTGNASCSGIATYNQGTIENCYNWANIEVYINDDTLTAQGLMGGITVNQEGNKVINCFNYGNLYANGKGDRFEIGGISRNLVQVNSSIENSYNRGNISAEISNSNIISIGGILAYTYLNNLQLNNLYSNGKMNIKGNTNRLYVGGIVGYDTNGKVSLKNSYSISEIIDETTSDNKNIGNIYGRINASNTTIANCYYLDQNNYYGIGSEQSDTNIIKIQPSQKQELLTKLNEAENGIWKKDEKNVNKGYPILIWQ